jgi:phage terminase large subunit
MATIASPRSTTEIDGLGGWYTEPHQDALWRYLEAGGLRATAIWHRRAGKDDVAMHWACKAAHKRRGNYWHMLPQAEQARKAIWDAINPHTGIRRIDEAFPLPLRKRTLNNEMKIELKCGSFWQVVGSDNFNALVGSPPVGIVFSEWALADPHAWAYMRPILRENGGWAIFITTPRGKNHGWKLLQAAKAAKGWFHQVLSADQTGVFTQAELEEERLELIGEYGEEMGQNLYEQEYMCSFEAAIMGAIYARQMRRLTEAGRITQVPHDPSLEVHTAWDLGYGDATAIWFFQIARSEVHLIDYVQNTGKDARFYASALAGQELELRNGRVWRSDPVIGSEHRQRYHYGQHHGPHDTAAKTLAAGGRSFGDQMNDFGYSMNVIPATNQADQINGARKTLESCWFDEKMTEKGRDGLTSYHYAWDDKKRMLADEPYHDWSSHPSDAFEIIGQVWQPVKTVADKPKPKFLNDMTADDVFWDKEQQRSRMERL